MKVPNLFAYCIFCRKVKTLDEKSANPGNANTGMQGIFACIDNHRKLCLLLSFNLLFRLSIRVPIEVRA